MGNPSFLQKRLRMNESKMFFFISILFPTFEKQNPYD